MNTIAGDEPFTDIFLYAAGESEVPTQFFFWSALSLIAACVEDRIWMEKFNYQKIYPNLYTFLIGKSAAGKGVAIRLTRAVLQQMEYDGRGTPPDFRGRLTQAALQDEMAERWKESVKRSELYNMDTPESTSLYFVCPELSSAVGTGPNAKDLIKLMTDWWEGGIGTYHERTRMHGKMSFRNPTLNCLAGTTSDWCREVIEQADLKSGFWARVCCVTGERDYDKRVYEPDTAGWQLSAQWLSWRLSLLLGKNCEDDLAFHGQMKLSPEAKAIDKAWYEDRAKPTSEQTDAHWARQQDMIWKIAMLLKMGDYFDLQRTLQGDDSWKIIGPEHIIKARQLSDQLVANAEEYATQALMHHFNGAGGYVMDIIKKEKAIRQTPELLQKSSRYGLKAKELNKIVEDLEDQEKIKRTFLGGGKVLIEWAG